MMFVISHYFGLSFCYTHFASHTCKREVLCSFFWTLEERWWNSTAIRPRWANSWFGLDSSANMLKELSSLFSWLASSMFSWGRGGIATAADSACAHAHTRHTRAHTDTQVKRQSVIPLNLTQLASYQLHRYFEWHRPRGKSHLAAPAMKSRSWLETWNQFDLSDLNSVPLVTD